MLKVSKTILINGVETDLLFTPRLFVMAEEKGITINLEEKTLMRSLSAFADICYCAALNAWTLDNYIEDFKLERKDFHEWSAAEPKEFSKAMAMAIEAMSGKTMAEIAKEQNEAKEAGKEVKKKKWPSFSGWIIRQLKHFWSAIVA